MSRRSITTVTFRVKMRLPPGATIPQAQAFIRAGIEGAKRGMPPQDPLASLDMHEVTIALEKRETAYLEPKSTK